MIVCACTSFDINCCSCYEQKTIAISKSEDQKDLEKMQDYIALAIEECHKKEDHLNYERWNSLYDVVSVRLAELALKKPIGLFS